MMGARATARPVRLAVLADDDIAERPMVRSDCASVARPCPHLGCRHHLAIEVGAHGAIQVVGGSTLPASASDDEFEAFVDEAIARARAVGSCVLDIADRNPDGATLQTIGATLDVSRERIRQIERRALRSARRRTRRAVGSAAVETLRPGAKATKAD